MARCFFSSISRARSAPEARRSQASEWRGGCRVKTNASQKNLKLEADNSEREKSGNRLVVFRIFAVFLHAFGPSNRLAIQRSRARACPLANPDSNIGEVVPILRATGHCVRCAGRKVVSLSTDSGLAVADFPNFPTISI